MLNRYSYVSEIIAAIERAPDSLARVHILIVNKDNASLRAVIQYLYDYRYNFEYVGVPNFPKGDRKGVEVRAALDYLNRQLNLRGTVSRDDADKHIATAVKMLGPDDGRMLERLLGNDIDLKITPSEILDVFPEIRFRAALAEMALPLDLAALQYPGLLVHRPAGPLVWLQVEVGQSFKLVTDDGQALSFDDKQRSRFHALLGRIHPVGYKVALECVFTAEIAASKTTSFTLLDKYRTSGIDTGEGFRLTVMDAIGMPYFTHEAQSMPVPYWKRNSWIKSCSFNTEYLEPAKTHVVSTVEDMRALEDTVATGKDTYRFYTNLMAKWDHSFVPVTRELF